MYNAGLMSRFVQNYEETYTPKCDAEKLFNATPVITMTDVIFIFYGFILGILLCFLICIGEYLAKYFIRLNRIFTPRPKTFSS